MVYLFRPIYFAFRVQAKSDKTTCGVAYVVSGQGMKLTIGLKHT